MEYNPFARDTQINPYPVYRWLRDEAPVYHNPDVDFYALSRFDDVLQAHLDTKTFLSSHGVTIEDSGSANADLLITKDDPEHNWHRKLVSRVFTPRAITDLESAVRRVAAEALDDARERGELEVVGDLSGYLPMAIIAEMLGVPIEVRTHLRELSDRALARPDDGVAETPPDAIAASQEMTMLLLDVVADIVKHPGDDIASMLLEARVTDDEGRQWALTHEQVAIRLLELAFAGHETTAKLIANGVVALSWYPDQRRELAQDPGLAGQAVEEMLRWDPPSHFQGRWVEEDVTLHGVTIPADSRVVLVTGAAQHDERVFDDPELFDLHRTVERHVGFGFGSHLCIGAALARLETRVAFEELLARFPRYEIASPVVRAYSSNVRGLASLPIVLEPAG
jgi:cytochrome P450